MIGKTSGRRDKTLYTRQSHRSTSQPHQQNSSSKHKQRQKKWEYTIKKILGRGTFGMVYLGLLTSGSYVAVKKVIQDDNYKNREYEIIREMNHPNVVRLYHSYFKKETNEENKEKIEIYLYLIMEYIPEDLHRLIRYFHQQGQFPNILIKLYIFQMLKALNYLQINNICHRDIKPRNILIDLNSHTLKICDFGSAKKIVKGESNLAYVCSRYYRAPELELGYSYYTMKSDVWSVGTVMAEMVLGVPIFLSETSTEHMAVIISKLGTPSPSQMEALNPEMMGVYDMIPKFKAKEWKNILPRCDPELRDLISKLLVYTPSKRLSPAQALFHPYFNELKEAKVNGKSFKFLFNFTEGSLTLMQMRNTNLKNNF